MGFFFMRYRRRHGKRPLAPFRACRGCRSGGAQRSPPRSCPAMRAQAPAVSAPPSHTGDLTPPPLQTIHRGEAHRGASAHIAAAARLHLVPGVLEVHNLVARLELHLLVLLARARPDNLPDHRLLLGGLCGSGRRGRGGVGEGKRWARLRRKGGRQQRRAVWEAREAKPGGSCRRDGSRAWEEHAALAGRGRLGDADKDAVEERGELRDVGGGRACVRGVCVCELPVWPSAGTVSRRAAGGQARVRTRAREGADDVKLPEHGVLVPLHRQVGHPDSPLAVNNCVANLQRLAAGANADDIACRVAQQHA